MTVRGFLVLIVFFLSGCLVSETPILTRQVPTDLGFDGNLALLRQDEAGATKELLTLTLMGPGEYAVDGRGYESLRVHSLNSTRSFLLVEATPENSTGKREHFFVTRDGATIGFVQIDAKAHLAEIGLKGRDPLEALFYTKDNTVPVESIEDINVSAAKVHREWPPKIAFEFRLLDLTKPVDQQTYLAAKQSLAPPDVSTALLIRHKDLTSTRKSKVIQAMCMTPAFRQRPRGSCTSPG